MLSPHSTPAKVEGFLPDNDGLKKTLEGAEIVVIPAGVPRKPGMTRDDLFNVRSIHVIIAHLNALAYRPTLRSFATSQKHALNTALKHSSLSSPTP